MTTALAAHAELRAASGSTTERRASKIYQETYEQILRRTDRMFGWLMLGQWVFGIGLALVISPYVWAGASYSPHLHVYAAVLLGGVISSLPWLMIRLYPGAFATRIVIACAQVLWSALLIHLTGGRIETHFHVFGSLAILAFYRDVRVLVLATVIVALDHFVRGFYWPESVYGLAYTEWWRFLEHAAWVVFIDVFLIMHCLHGQSDLREAAQRTAEVEALSDQEREKGAALNRALEELGASQEALLRNERLAAVGKLAASVGHELRNPLTAIKNAHTYIGKKMDMSSNGHGPLDGDPRIKQFRNVIERELDACSKIISDLLDFARARPPTRRPCPLKPLIFEAIEIVPKRDKVTISAELPDDLPVPELDKDQFRQVFVNLIQNASEAFEEEQAGAVIVRAEQLGSSLYVSVVDNGRGMSPDVAAKIFQPLYSTKTKGTGLGLSIVQGTVERHGATLKLESQPDKGTTFVIEVPLRPAAELGLDGQNEELRAHSVS